MNKIVILIVLLLLTDLIVAAPKAINRRGTHGYGPPIHISSSVLNIQQAEGSLHEGADTDGNGKYLSIGEFGAKGENHHDLGAGSSSGYLKFAGIVGSGHIYVPDDSDHHFGKISDGILGTSQW